MVAELEGELTLVHSGHQEYESIVRSAHKQGIEDILVYCFREDDLHPFVRDSARVVEVGLGEPVL